MENHRSNSPLGEVIENGSNIKFVSKSDISYNFYASPRFRITLSNEFCLLYEEQFHDGKVSPFLFLLDRCDKVRISCQFQPHEKVEKYVFVINFNETYFLLSCNTSFLVTPKEIKLIKIKCLSSSNIPIPVEQVLGCFASCLDSESIKSYVIPTQLFEDKYYIILNPYLFRFEFEGDDVLLQCVDENLDIFNYSSISFFSKGILSNDPINHKAKEIAFTLYHPTKHELYIAKIKCPNLVFVHCLSVISGNRIAIVSKEDKVVRRFAQVCVTSKEYQVCAVINISDINFELSNYKYSTPVLTVSCKNYKPKSDSGFQVIKSKKDIFFYQPILPIKSYHVVCGFGDIPSSFKAPNYQQLDDKEINSQLGAPILFVFDFNDKVIQKGFINELPDKLALTSWVTVSIDSDPESSSTYKREGVKWLGIVEPIS